MDKNHKNGKVNFKMILIVICIIAGSVFYWYETRDSLSKTYQIRTAAENPGYEPTYINRTGKDAKEKKIKLSDDYWTSGKFHF